MDSADKALRNLASLRHLNVRVGATRLGDLYIQPPRSHPPGWAGFFKDYLDVAKLGRVSTTAAVFLVDSENRLFVLAFGQGRHLLEPGVWEERFGLRVVLNSIDENKLRSIDKRTFDAISRHTRVQSSREAAAREFGLDIEQDLLRAATGSPKDEMYGKRLSGMDSLHAAVRTELYELRRLLTAYLDKFKDDSYKESFPWVDHISEVSAPAAIAALNALLVARMQNGNVGRCWLAVPEIIEWAEISGFRYKFGARDPQYHDLHLPDFLSTLPDTREVSAELLRSRYAQSIDLTGQPRHRWSIYQCLYCEVDHEGDTYLLSGSKWYRVKPDFVQAVNRFIFSIPTYARQLPEYADASEGAYCDRVAKECPAQYALMDQKEIMIGGGYSKIEFCDLYTDARDLIHVKRYGASSVLSHLFSQGVVSGEAFRSDSGFRSAVNDRLPPAYRIEAPEQAPEPSSYQVVFAVVSDQPGDVALPFFSRVNLKHAATRLQAYGYRIALAKINVSQSVSTLKWYKAN